MRRVAADTTVPGRAADAEELWYDQHRWPAWIDFPAGIYGTPDIDGRVYIAGSKLHVGEFATVKVIGHTDYDLIANRSERFAQ